MYRISLDVGSDKPTVYDVNATLLVISGAGKTRSRYNDVIVSVVIDVTADDVPAYDVIFSWYSTQWYRMAGNSTTLQFKAASAEDLKEGYRLRNHDH